MCVNLQVYDFYDQVLFINKLLTQGIAKQKSSNFTPFKGKRHQ